MPIQSIDELVPILQVAIGPVILISGVGLLLLSMTSRLGRVIDRARLLAQQVRQGLEGDQARVPAQIRVLEKRARLIRGAIIFASVSLLMAAVLIVSLFVAALFGLQLAWLVAAIFIGSMVALIASLTAFIWDVHLSLIALKHELEGVGVDDMS